MLLTACSTTTPDPIAAIPTPAITFTATYTNTPTATPTETPTPTPTFTLTPSPTATLTPSPTYTPSPTPTLSPEELREASQLGNLDVFGKRQVVDAAYVFFTPTTTPIYEPAPRGSLIKPPEGVTLDQHLWFGRPITNGNSAPSSQYRFGMTFGGVLPPHHGVDIAGNTGQAVSSIGNATVYFAGNDLEVQFGPRTDFFGNLVVLQMNDSWRGQPVFALYAHLHEVFVETGSQVVLGQAVGSVGSTGVAPAPHLHFEIRLGSPENYWAVRNPELWYNPIGGHGAIAGRVIDTNGSFVSANDVYITCGDKLQRRVRTYWDQGTPADDVLVENFVISDLPAGSCTVETTVDRQPVKAEVSLAAGQVSFVILQPEEDW